jgi:hypothetical protein
MSDEAAQPPAPLCLDDLMDSACDCLELCGDRGLEIGPGKSMIDEELEKRNSSRLQTLVARVESKIRKHDAASVCASSASPASAAIAPATSSEAAPKFQSHVQSSNS